MNRLHLFINKVQICSRIVVYLCPLLLMVACADTAEPGATAFPTPTPLPTPVVPEKPVYTVQRGVVVNTLEFTARVSPVLEQELFFKTDGFVGQVLVARGDRVEAGDILARLEISDLEGQLAQAQIALQTAEITLAKAEQALADQLLEAQINVEMIELQLSRGYTQDTSAALVRTEINLENARQQVADAEYELQKSRDREWEPEEERKRYERELELAQENLAVTEAEYNDARAGSSLNHYDIEILEKELELAQLRVAELERGIDPLLELDVEKARLDIAEIERQIADASLVAPFDGQVLSLSIRAGDRVEAFSTVAVLAEPERLEVTADLSSEQLSQMSLNQVATIRLRNRPEQDFDGFVRQLPYPYGGGATGVDESDTAVRIALNDPVDLELGELATVVIVLEEKENVLWLPPAAIRTFQGRNFVVVQNGGVQQRVDVRLGIESAERIEIVEGLEEGQLIAGE